MCYFIQLAITPQGRPAEAQAIVDDLAKQHKLSVRGQYPDGLTVTDNMCACRLVTRKGLKAPVPDFLRELVSATSVKSIQVGWRYEGGLYKGGMPDDTVVERLSIQEFMSRNEAHDLAEDVWYRLNAPEKYLFESTHTAA